MPPIQPAGTALPVAARLPPFGWIFQALILQIFTSQLEINLQLRYSLVVSL
jgi:hypothetical protein